MNSKYFCLFIVTLSIFTDIASASIRSGRITQNSHPMLASIFNVANNIRRLHQDGGQKRQRQTVRGGGQIGNVLVDQRLKPQHGIVKLVTQSNPQKDKRTDPMHNRADSTLLPAVDHIIMKQPDALLVAESHSGTSGKVRFPSPGTVFTPGSKTVAESGAFVDIGNLKSMSAGASIVGLSADMLCSLCRRQGNATCIAMHCWNDQATLSGVEPSLLFPQPATMLPDNFDFRSQIGRHDLLQFSDQKTNQNTNMKKRDFKSADFPNQTSGSTKSMSTAPVWLLSDSLIDISSSAGSSTTNVEPLLSMSDNVEFIPATDRTVFDVVTGAHKAVHAVPAMDQRPAEIQNPGQEIAFVDRAVLHPLFSDSTASPQSLHTVSKLDNNPSTFSNVVHHPIEISTDILRRLIQIEELSSRTTDTISNKNTAQNAQNEHDESIVGAGQANSNTVNTVVTSGNHLPVPRDVFDNSNNERQDQKSSFPGFVEGNAILRAMDLNSGSNVPLIPTANDVFSNVINVKETDNIHTLVIKSHGASEVVGVHLGNGPILRKNIRPLEMTGQNAEPQRAVNQRINSDTLTRSTEQHSDHSSHGHRPLVVGHKNIQVVPMKGIQQESVVRDKTVRDHHVVENIFTTTTPVPTIEPVRRVELQNWSRELLQRMNV